MSTPTITPFPLPVAPYGTIGDVSDGEDLYVSYGYCRDFCTLDGPTHAQQVVSDVNDDGHPPFCESPYISVTDCLDAETGERTVLALCLVGRYMHGGYRRSDLWKDGNIDYVRFDVSDPDDGRRRAFIAPASQVRSIAVALTYLADQLELPQEPLNLAKARREQE